MENNLLNQKGAGKVFEEVAKAMFAPLKAERAISKALELPEDRDDKYGGLSAEDDIFNQGEQL